MDKILFHENKSSKFSSLCCHFSAKIRKKKSFFVVHLKLKICHKTKVIFDNFTSRLDKSPENLYCFLLQFECNVKRGE